MIKTTLSRFLLLLLFVYQSPQLMATPPDWIPPENLQYNMQIVAFLELEGGGYSTNENDLVAAFVGDQCRGIASPIADAEGRVFLSVGSDELTGETVTFKAYYAVQGQIADLNESVAFVSETLIGEYNDPFVFTIGVLYPPAVYTIEAGSNENGTINPTGNVSVVHGSNQLFTFTPQPDFAVFDVQVDGVSVGIADQYEFVDVTAPHSIFVTFAFPESVSDEKDKTPEIVVFPNPVTNQLKIKGIRETVKETNYLITDLSGKIMSSGVTDTSEPQINTSTLPAGIFVLTLLQEGQKTVSINFEKVY
jgi:hypothetical protein